MSVKRTSWLVGSAALLIAITIAACGSAGEPTPPPTPTRPLRPTFTPTPLATDTPTPIPPTPTPVDTPTPEVPTPTPEPPTPTPETNPIAVATGSAQVNVRSGPGTAYPQVGQVANGTELEIVGRNQAGDWWQVCCVNGQEVWIVARLVSVRGDTGGVQVAANIPAPPPTPTPRPVAPRPAPQPAQPTSPPAPSFQFVQISNEARVNTNPIVTFFGGLYNATRDLSKPVTGYKMIVVAPSGERREADFGPVFLRGDPGLSGEFLYNAKIELPTADGVYRVWVADPGGNQVAPAFESSVSGDTRTFLPRWKLP